MAVPASGAKREQAPIQFQEFDNDNKDMLSNDFSEVENVWVQALISINSVVQIALQEMHNKVASEEPSPIKTAKLVFISIGFGLNTLFGIVETAIRVVLLTLPFLAALAIKFAINATRDDLFSNIVLAIMSSVGFSLAYTLESGISTVTNLQYPNKRISYRGQFNGLFSDSPQHKQGGVVSYPYHNERYSDDDVSDTEY